MNSRKSKTSDIRDYYSILHIKQTLKEEINVLLYQILVLLYVEKYKNSNKNNKFQISTLTWN